MTQKSTAQSGIPIVYSGAMVMPDAGDDDATVKIGTVTP